MEKSKRISWLAGGGFLVVVLVISFWFWTKTTPSGELSALDSSLAPLKTDQISKDAISKINTLQKNGDVPVVVNQANLGKDDPFTAAQ